ncbi:hypothetical protein AAVH_14896, partial [Aphelenchoides avenae]
IQAMTTPIDWVRVHEFSSTPHAIVDSPCCRSSYRSTTGTFHGPTWILLSLVLWLRIRRNRYFRSDGAGCLLDDQSSWSGTHWNLKLLQSIHASTCYYVPLGAEVGRLHRPKSDDYIARNMVKQGSDCPE